MQIRHANTTTESRDAEGRVFKTVNTYNLGHWEQWKIQEAIALLPAEDRVHLEHLAHILGSCPQTEITITATYEI